MNKIYLFEVFIGILVLITTIFNSVGNGLTIGLILILILFLPPFNYHLRNLDERELILELKSERLTGYLLLIILAILFRFPNIELGKYNMSEIWFPIAFGLKIFMDGIVSLYLFNNSTLES
jgi:hypothetical protein